MYTMCKRGRDFCRSGAVTDEQLDHITDNSIGDIMKSIRPHAVMLVDSWKFPDYLLNRYVHSTRNCMWTED